MSENNEIAELRARRAEVSRSIERKRLRDKNGEALARGLSMAASEPLNLQDFNVDEKPPFDVLWAGDIRGVAGLVIAYVHKDVVCRVASCIQSKIPAAAGKIGLHGNDYLGLCAINNISLTGMVDAAEATNDSIVFYPAWTRGAIVVDCYASNPGDAFSLFVQGGRLEEILSDCFARL